jgi:hypothetical protein
MHRPPPQKITSTVFQAFKLFFKCLISPGAPGVRDVKLIGFSDPFRVAVKDRSIDTPPLHTPFSPAFSL